MKAINPKFAALGFAAILFAACSDSNSASEGVIVDPPMTNLDFENIHLKATGAEELAARVTNYKSSVSTKSRAADATLFEGLLDMPEMPSVPSNAIDLSTVTNLDDLSKGGTYVIKKGKSIDFTKHSYLKGCTIYIEAGGTMTYDGTSGNNIIYVLGNGDNSTPSKNGTLDFRGTGLSGSSTSGADKIYCYGIIKVADRFVVHNGGSFYKEGNLSIEDKYMDIYGNLYVNGSVKAKGLRVRDNAKVNITNKAAFSGENLDYGDMPAEFEKKTAVHVGGQFTAPSLVLNSANFTADCSVRLYKNLEVNANSTLKANYINVTTKENSADATVNQKGNSKIILGTKGVFNADTYTTDNTEGQMELADNNGVAVVKIGNFIYGKAEDTDATIKSFNTAGENSTFLFEFKNTYKNGTKTDANKIDFKDLDIDASYMHYAESGVETKEKEDKCGYELTGTDITKLPKLDLISSIDYDHNHDISATCIQPSNGNIYVSYHTRGKEHGACLESFTMNNNTATMKSAIMDKENDLDYNHLMLDGNRVYVAGSSVQYGAILGSVNANSGTLDAESGITIYPIDKKVEKVDANCVVKSGNNLVVATTRGYEIFDTNNKNSVATEGKVKHLALANNKIYALSLTGTNSDVSVPIDGKVEIFNDASMTNPEVSQNIGKIQPTDGKNTIAVDGNKIYVCRGENGLVAYDNNGQSMKESWTWSVPVNTKKNSVKGYCNGVAFDSNHIYVACGGYGLVVLDKNGNEITHRTVADGNSANYVAIENGYIYVAYGKSRLQIFKLTETAK